MGDADIYVLLAANFVLCVVLLRRSWNRHLRDIEPFIFILGFVPAAFFFVMGLAMVTNKGQIFSDPWKAQHAQAERAARGASR